MALRGGYITILWPVPCFWGIVLTKSVAGQRLKILYLTTDAYGGYGGVALYNRDVIESLCADEAVAEVVCIPRVVFSDIGALPPKLNHDLAGTGGAAAWIRTVIRHVSSTKFDLIYCGHMNLAPVAWLAARLSGTPWALCLYGIDAWEKNASARRKFFASRADRIISLSRVTLRRFLSWCPVEESRCVVLPNAIHLETFGVAPRDPALEARYGLAGKKVILTFGRLDPAEQYKGFDEIIELLPKLRESRPDIAYLIAGSGKDADRLKAKAAALGLADHVIFTGMVDEAEKADTYRLADVYAMPSRGEGFGFVLLEAMACGVPAIASNQDGGQEAVRDGLIGQVVDPADLDAITAAITKVIDQPKEIPEGLHHFAFPAFRERLQIVIHGLVARAAG